MTDLPRSSAEHHALRLSQEAPAHTYSGYPLLLVALVCLVAELGGFGLLPGAPVVGIALIVLVGIGELSVTPLRSTWVHVVGDDLGWKEVARLLDGAGAEWDGALFAARTDRGGGPLPDAAARIALRDLGDEVLADRTVLNAGHFFDRRGRRLKVEEVRAQ